MLPRDAAPAVVRRLDYRPPTHLVDTVDLKFELAPEATRVTTRFTYRRNAAAQADEAMVLFGERQSLLAVNLNGKILDNSEYTLTESALTLTAIPSSGWVETVSECNPGGNTSLEGLYVSSGVFCTQCEAEGFRRFAFFPDRPDVLARYTVTIVADKTRYPVLLSNGNLIEQGDLPGSKLHFARWHDPFPKPSYLFALVAGDLKSLDDEFVTMSGRKVRLRIFSTPDKLALCHHAMAALKRAMRWDEQRFGREYDLDTFMIFCADDFNLGAMENKGLNIFNSSLVLADPATATDNDYLTIESVIAHEYFHNWTGNRVTCRDWFQLSLKEGLTVFRDQEYSSDVGSRAVERINAVDYLRAQQFPEDAGPMAHPVRPDSYAEVNNFYTATVYEKGAEVIRMQHTLLGADAFRRGTDLYFDRHDGQAVTCDDFVQAMQDSSGVDLDQFRRWYAQAGTPELTIRGTYVAAEKKYTLGIDQVCKPTQGQPRKEPFHIPLAVGLVGADGTDLPLRLQNSRESADADPTTRVLHLRQASESFTFVDVREAPVPSLLRGFSAPVKVVFDFDERELALLAAHDSDPVGRWDAAQRMYAGAIMREAERRRAGHALTLAPTLSAVVSALLADRSSDPALVALALRLPRLSILADQQTPIDVDNTHAARMFVLAALGREFGESFGQVYEESRSGEAYVADSPQIARRSLKNTCLAFLVARGDRESRALALAQFATSDNMTDSMAALAALNDSEGDEREEALARFETRWRGNPLVMDKWLALQAMSSRPGTLSAVRALMQHPAYDPRNPNRIRSLIGTFALSNLPTFHAADGSGYAFVADQVLAIDRTNPQIAARIVSAFNRRRRFDPARSALQRQMLEHIAAVPTLSTGVAEIVAHGLAA